MATPADNLLTRYAAICDELAAGQTPAGQSFRQPDMSVDGESAAMVAYRTSLLAELQQITAILAGMGINVDGTSLSYEIIVEGTT